MLYGTFDSGPPAGTGEGIVDETFVPEIVLLYCRRCLRPGDDIAAAAGRVAGFSLRPVMMPCSSKVEVHYLLGLLEKGADGVQMAVCPEPACRFLVGSARAGKRIAYVRGLLDSIGYGGDRVGFSPAASLSGDELAALAGDRADAVRSLGPNPMKKGVAS
jgi:coenzyme F420-reducing hydrogenase delta subunit